jgi:hypothetical protein
MNESIDDLVREVTSYVTALQAENVRLRELCKGLAEFLTEAEWLQWPELRAEMRKLGVEVDG